jgi:hypothetical protein
MDLIEILPQDADTLSKTALPIPNGGDSYWLWLGIGLGISTALFVLIEWYLIRRRRNWASGVPISAVGRKRKASVAQKLGRTLFRQRF